MSAGKVTAGLLGGTGSLIAAAVSPIPVLVIGGLIGLIILTLAAVVLIAAFSTDVDRHAHAVTAIDRVLAAIPGAQPWTPPALSRRSLRRPPAPAEPSEPAAETDRRAADS